MKRWKPLHAGGAPLINILSARSPNRIIAMAIAGGDSKYKCPCFAAEYIEYRPSIMKNVMATTTIPISSGESFEFNIFSTLLDITGYSSKIPVKNIVIETA